MESVKRRKRCTECKRLMPRTTTSEGKRPLTPYQQFIKDTMNHPAVKALGHKDRMAYCSQRWHEHKASKET